MPNRTCLAQLLAAALLVRGVADNPHSPGEVFAEVVAQISAALDRARHQTVSDTLEWTRADGLPRELAGRKVDIAVQPPERLRLPMQSAWKDSSRCRYGRSRWRWRSRRKNGFVGLPTAFKAAAPSGGNQSRLPIVGLPLTKGELEMIPFLFRTESLKDEELDGIHCRVVKARLTREAELLLRTGPILLTIAARERDSLPMRIDYSDGSGLHATVVLHHLRVEKAWASGRWSIPAAKGSRITQVPLSQFRGRIDPVLQALTECIPAFNPTPVPSQ